ncbi:hypothetical protein T01_8388 [Trichinella spiralis]|uniref:Uncharacterized protein n=1 Tax=Trichinella spiralis TaxID=6334 RepID=A0A0V1B0V5_TRISP|nr:hypothetical protein T01_8388 [Trichinella spiralis]
MAYCNCVSSLHFAKMYSLQILQSFLNAKKWRTVVEFNALAFGHMRRQQICSKNFILKFFFEKKVAVRESFLDT